MVLGISALVLYSCKPNEEPTPDPGPDPVKISISDFSLDEGGDYTNISIQLQLDAAATQQITASISTTDGTAESNKDYVPLDNQAVVFAAGETQKTVEITITGDLVLEEDEYFEVTIVSVTGPATIDNGTATVDILNDDEMGVQEVPVVLTVDWEELLTLPQWSEAPYEVMNFGQPESIPNAEFTSVAALNDTIFFNPKFSTEGDTILYYGIDPDPGFNFSEYFEYIGFSLSPSDSVSIDIKLAVLNNDVSDVETKYDLLFMVGTVDQGRFGPFRIDPKLRIPGQ